MFAKTIRKLKHVQLTWILDAQSLPEALGFASDVRASLTTLRTTLAGNAWRTRWTSPVHDKGQLGVRFKFRIA